MATNMEQYYDRVYRYCYFKLGNGAVAEDITQETFLKYYAHNPSIGPERQLAYLYTIAGNLCIDQYRKKQTVPIEDDLPQAGIMEAVEAKTAVEQAMEALEPQERELVFLRYINDLPVGDLAKLLGISRFAVHRKTEAALKKLKQQLKKEDFYG